MSKVDAAVVAEAIAVIPDDSVQVCLVNVGAGTPFISALALRPLENSLYPQANATQGLVLIDRRSLGDTGVLPVRYPDDPYDRAWVPWSDPEVWTDISTTEKVRETIGNLRFHVPSAVMQSAIIARNDSRNKTIDFSWDVEPNHAYPVPGCIGILYVAELQILASNDVREFNVIANSKKNKLPYTLEYLVADAISNMGPHHGYNQYNYTMIATANSTLPPIINAFEFFSVISTANIGTDSQDVSAINAIKAKYHVKKNWMGDPCAPKNFAWDGLTCSYAISGRPRITSINVSSGGLSGDISPYFADIKDLQYLDLSNNKLTGSIPNVLSRLPTLLVLDLTANQLSGSIPPGLLKRTQGGPLVIRYGNNPNLCSNNGSCQLTKKKTNSMLAAYIVVPVFVVLLIGALVVLLIFRVRNRKGLVREGNGHGHHELENRQFTYRELKVITDNFKVVLGQGGFGTVYDGFLHDGTHVAVKLLSQSSSQGIKEFSTEAQTLTKIHHKNLISLIGYCKEGKYLALVYEHMSEGNLEDKLRGKDGNVVPLAWRQRLRIALESAEGLDYLHKACSPPFVHRDVKTSNILLNANLEAKVADFGLMKAFNHDDDTHVSTARVIGTRGYLAPEYATVLQLNEKSDVYSFGIILLEVITGCPAIQQSGGNIDEVVDPHMQGDYNINVMWKAVDLALKCTDHAPAQRPTMTNVVAQLQHCLELEGEDHTGKNRNSSFYMTANCNGDHGLLM
uniref:non-specific serine/threonine protein kinase n=1 Tax=Aegilops tauschii TaxID=37682 RepID=R7W4M3_AEGTA